VSVAISKDKEPSYSGRSRTISCPRQAESADGVVTPFCAHFVLGATIDNWQIKDLARLSRLDLRVPRRELIYLVLTHLEEQFAGIARVVCQILNLQTRVRFPVALPYLPKLFISKRIRLSEVLVPTRVSTSEGLLRKNVRKATGSDPAHGYLPIR